MVWGKREAQRAGDDVESESCEDGSQGWWFLSDLLYSGSSGRWISVVSSLVYMGKSRPPNYIVRPSQRTTDPNSARQ